jgi:hypothetical protein
MPQGPHDVDDIRLIRSASPPAMIFRDGASGCNGSEARDGEHAPRCDSDQARVRVLGEDRRCGTSKEVLDSPGITTLPMWSGTDVCEGVCASKPQDPDV